MQHIIKKQTILLELHQEKDAFDLQHKMSERYWKDIVPMLQRIFDKLSSEEVTIYIDKFEIDLSKITQNDIDSNEWIEQLEVLVEEQIREILGLTHKSTEAIKKPRAINIFTQWLNYMETGQLPWNAGRPDSDWRDKVIEAIAVDYESVEQLRRKILSHPFVLNRIISQHDEKFLVNLATVLSAYRHESIPKILDELLDLIEKLNKSGNRLLRIETDAKSWRFSQWKILLAHAAKKSTIHFESPATPIIKSILIDVNSAIRLPGNLAKDFQETLSLIAKIQEEFIHPGSNLIKDIEKQESEINLILQKISRHEMDSPTIIYEKEKMLGEEEGIYVTHAGIILVHPFLKILFNRLGMVSGGNFIPEEMKSRAILLLHYVASGLSEAEEYELTVAKILCELPIDFPLNGLLELTDLEKEEADQMLLALIQQWKLLKNTSITGLRESFLQRPGKLFKRNGNLCLQVESSSIDMLLDYLPWNLSIIKLPWMSEMLRVEWR